MAEEENQLDIDLAYRTLEWIGTLQDNEIKSYDKTRQIVANLCDFQERFATPIQLPFQLGNDLHQRLPTRRPIGVLIHYKLVCQIDGDLKIEPEDGMTCDGKTFCFVGGQTWKGYVKEGKLNHVPFKPPIVAMSEWIKDLFELFEVATKFNFDRKADARRLVACWYHIATQIDFSPPDEEERFDPEQFLALTLGALTGQQKRGITLDDFMKEDYDSEEDEDYDPEKESPEDDDDDISNEEPDLDDSEGDHQDTEKKGGTECIDQKESEGKTIRKRGNTESVKEQEVKSVIFRVVDSLGAHMPSPIHDLAWFKRVLKQVRVCQSTGDTTWYPWGCPPLVPLVNCTKSEDPHLVSLASTIILLFQNQGNTSETTTTTTTGKGDEE